MAGLLHLPPLMASTSLKEPKFNRLFNDARLVMSVLIEIVAGGTGTVAKAIISTNKLLYKILKKCKEAIPSKENGGKVIIIDMVILDSQKGDDKSYETQIYMDMLTMVVVSGKQKTEQEWAKLFFDAGYSDYNIIPILGLRCVIEVYP
ncbi:trans-resveratrol di-O-methyltransferase-like [Solanum tuberosum]|uniref:trans-resveratrol di-O-methyltransferase-like n=1 Tax=Solanum tuberosum TaxID=4113 RepID=UPI00073A0020|nr:PREDICTED: trans-resveratrol di-O-methyltransferase-like [Solanum tuberosum]